EPAAPRPLLDRPEQGLRLVAEDPAVEVDEEQRRARSEFALALFADDFKVRLVLLSEELIPYPLAGLLSHRCVLLSVRLSCREGQAMNRRKIGEDLRERRSAITAHPHRAVGHPR